MNIKKMFKKKDTMLLSELVESDKTFNKIKYHNPDKDKKDSKKEKTTN